MLGQCWRSEGTCKCCVFRRSPWPLSQKLCARTFASFVDLRGLQWHWRKRREAGHTGGARECRQELDASVPVPICGALLRIAVNNLGSQIGNHGARVLWLPVLRRDDSPPRNDFAGSRLPQFVVFQLPTRPHRNFETSSKPSGIEGTSETRGSLNLEVSKPRFEVVCFRTSKRGHLRSSKPGFEPRELSVSFALILRNVL